MRRQFFAVAVAAPQQQDDRSDRPHRFHSSSAYRDTSSATARAGASRVRLSRGFRLRGQMVDVHKHGNPAEERSFGATFLFPTFFPFRVSSAPFALFPCVILAPVLNRAYSWSATFFSLRFIPNSKMCLPSQVCANLSRIMSAKSLRLASDDSITLRKSSQVMASNSTSVLARIEAFRRASVRSPISPK
jgi:hypothetical protein